MKSRLQLATNPIKENRQAEDFYATHPKALEIFLTKLEHYGDFLNKNIWECAAGMGHLSTLLESKGFNVVKSDIVDRGCNAHVKNFLECNKKYDGDILTNPPFAFAEQFIEKAFELLNEGNRLYLFLKVQFLESGKRKKLFEKYPPKYVYINSERQRVAKDGDFDKYTTNVMCFCWFVWEKGFIGETIVRWI